MVLKPAPLYEAMFFGSWLQLWLQLQRQRAGLSPNCCLLHHGQKWNKFILFPLSFINGQTLHRTLICMNLFYFHFSSLNSQTLHRTLITHCPIFGCVINTFFYVKDRNVRYCTYLPADKSLNIVCLG